MAFDAIRKRIWKNAEVGDLARDVSNAFGKFVGLALVEFDAVYVEPLPIGFTHEPKGCICIRVRSVDAPETPITCGALVHFVWIQAAKRMNATIDGLSPGVGRCRFIFLMVG